MSPIHDPRYSKARWHTDRGAEQEESRRGARAEYVKALAVMAVAMPASFLLALARHHAGFAAAAGGYLLWLAVAVAVGTVALVVSGRLFLGDTGPAGLSILRVAAMVSAGGVAYLLLGGGLSYTSVGAAGVVFLGLAMWLFDMDLEEAALAGAITLALVMAASVALLLFLAVG